MPFTVLAPRQAVGSGRGNVIERPMPPLWLVIHTSEQGAEFENSAEGLCAFIGTPATSTNVASYHYVIDTDKVFPLVRDDYRAHAAGGGNSQGLHICFPGKAAQTPAEWHDAISTAQLEQCARWLADKSQEYRIPLSRLDPQDLVEGNKGVCGHVDVTNAFHQSTHTDPGVNFPYDEVINRAAELRFGSEPIPDPPEDRPVVLDLAFLRPGNSHPDVVTLKSLLKKKFGQGGIAMIGPWRNTYGTAAVAGVRNVQTALGLTVDGVVGPVTWAALIQTEV